jgi:hypothetical protein
MKRQSVFALLLVVALLAAMPILAQDRGGNRGTSADTGGSNSSVASRATTPTTSTISSGTSVSRDYSSSGGSFSSSSPSYAGGRSVNSGGHFGGGGYIPNYQTSSFNSTGNYYQWQDFFYYLQMHYYMNDAYFSRFYRNREPLVTPELLKLTMRQPMKLSLQLLAAVDELELMIKARDGGKQVDRQAISSKTAEIRDLAKKIRQDESLAFFDQRRDKDVFKGMQADNLGLEAISQLREMATDLNTQLKGLYSQSQPSTVSVQSLTAPSFESLTKGIDKLSKVIENSARRM